MCSQVEGSTVLQRALAKKMKSIHTCHKHVKRKKGEYSEQVEEEKERDEDEDEDEDGLIKEQEEEHGDMDMGNNDNESISISDEELSLRGPLRQALAGTVYSIHNFSVSCMYF